MKRIVLIAFAGLFLAAVRGSDDTPTPTPTPTATPTPTPTPTPTEEKEGKILGTAVARGNGGFLGLEIKDECFVMTFYNAKKKPTPADVASAVMWWAVQYQPNNERVLLVPSDDPAKMSSPQVIRPPYTMKLHITLLSETATGETHPGGAAAAEPESYVVDFSG
jgi:hypothetical protein